MHNFSDFEKEQRMYLQNAPIKVYLAGFQSDTITLQQNGWQMSVEFIQNGMIDAVQQRVAFKHEGIQQYALGIYDFNYRYIMSGRRESLDYLSQIGIQISCVSPMIRFQVIPMRQVSSIFRFDPVGGLPEWKEIDLEDIAVFKPIKLDDTFDVVINQKDEMDLMKIILSKQDHKQAEIRQRRKREAFRMGQSGLYEPNIKDKQNEDIKCNIITVAS